MIYCFSVLRLFLSTAGCRSEATNYVGIEYLQLCKKNQLCDWFNSKRIRQLRDLTHLQSGTEYIRDDTNMTKPFRKALFEIQKPFPLQIQLTYGERERESRFHFRLMS